VFGQYFTILTTFLLRPYTSIYFQSNKPCDSPLDKNGTRGLRTKEMIFFKKQNGAPPMDRRQFLARFFRRTLVAAVLGLAAYPALSFVTFRKTTKKEVSFGPADRLSGVTFLDGAFLVNPGEQPYALSGRCTHLGCTVHFDPVSAQFKCPCHGSRFDLSGRRVSGPAIKDLARAPVVKKENGDLVVTLTL
jgi:cytochrome b6-f complex iron-sulfur subunit